MRLISDAEWARVVERDDFIGDHEEVARAAAGEEAAQRFRWYVVDCLERGVEQVIPTAMGRLLADLDPGSR